MPNIFLWSAGASPTLLRQCQDGETIRQQIIGTFVLLTGVFALLTSFYAFYSISDRVPVAVAGSLLWAAMIFTLDRFIVSSMKVVKKGNVYAIPFAQVVPRIVLACAIGVSVGVPLELYLFRAEIHHHLQKVYHNKKIADAGREEDEARKLFDRRRADEAQIRADCESMFGDQLRQLQHHIDRLEADIANTMMGRDITQQVGCARYCEQLKSRQGDLMAQKLKVSSERNVCLASKKPPSEAKQQAVEREAARWRAYEIQYEDNALLNPTILRQYQALQTISADRGSQQSGAAQGASVGADDGGPVGAAAIFIPLLLVFFEVVPVLTKYMAGASTYELLAMQERVVAVETAERQGIAAASQLSRLRIEHDRQIAMAEHESSTYKELHGTVHDRFKAAVAERIQARLHDWHKSKQLDDDITHLETVFSQVLRERFGDVLSGIAPGDKQPVGPRPMPPAPPPQPADAPARSASPHVAENAPALADPRPRDTGARAGSSAESPAVVGAYLRKLGEVAALRTTEVLSHVFSSSLTLIAGVPATVVGTLSWAGPAADPFILLPLAIGAFVAGRGWARRRSRQPAL